MKCGQSICEIPVKAILRAWRTFWMESFGGADCPSINLSCEPVMIVHLNLSYASHFSKVLNVMKNDLFMTTSDYGLSPAFVELIERKLFNCFLTYFAETPKLMLFDRLLTLCVCIESDELQQRLTQAAPAHSTLFRHGMKYWCERKQTYRMNCGTKCQS